MKRNDFFYLYSTDRKDLYRYCRSLCGNEFDADDLMQQTYLRAFENFDKFDGRNFHSWLCSVAKNIFLNNLKRSKFEYLTEELPEIPDNSQNPEFVAEKRDICRILLKALKDNLSPVQRMTVIFYYYDEKSVSEIANIMQCSENTVKSRLFSARKKLREELKKFGNIFTCLSLGFAVMKHKLKNIHIPVNARITVSAVMTASAMVSVSMASIPNENKLPHEIIRLESTSASEYANIRHINNKPTENKEETTMKKQIITAATAATMALTGMTAFQADAVSEIMTAESENPLYGDANNDKGVSISDSVAILQYVANESKYPIAEETKPNADVFNPGDGITGNDANSIMKFEAGTIESLPEYPETLQEQPESATDPTVNPDLETAGHDFRIDTECDGFILPDKTVKKYNMRAEYQAEMNYMSFVIYSNKYFAENENLIFDTDLYEKINSALPYNFFPYMKTELEKIFAYKDSLNEIHYLTEEKLPDLLRISSFRNDNYQQLDEECAEIIKNEFSEYVTGPYRYGKVMTEESPFKNENLFPIPDKCWHYYFIGSDHEENTRIAEEIISRVRQAMNEKYGDIAITDGDIWLDCHGAGHYLETGLEKRIANPELFGYDELDNYDRIRSTKNIYFPADSSEPVTYWDITESDDIS